MVLRVVTPTCKPGTFRMLPSTLCIYQTRQCVSGSMGLYHLPDQKVRQCVSGSLPSNKLAPLHHRLCTSEPGRLRLNREIQGEEQASLPSIWRILNVWKIKKDLTRIGLQCAPSKLHPVLRITWQDLWKFLLPSLWHICGRSTKIFTIWVCGHQVKFLICFQVFIRPAIKTCL